MKFITATGLEAARAELSSKSCEQIEGETAAKWACRAVVAYEAFVQTGDRSYFASYAVHAHEALEHAAEAGPGTVDAIRNELACEIGRREAAR